MFRISRVDGMCTRDEKQCSNNSTKFLRLCMKEVDQE